MVLIKNVANMNTTIERYRNRYTINERINWRSNMKPETRSSFERFKNRIDTYYSILSISLERKGVRFYSDGLSVKQILNMPSGIYDATDGIYDYQIKIYDKSEDNIRIVASIFLGENGYPYSQHVYIFRDTEPVFEEITRGTYHLKDLKKETITVLASCGGLSVHSKDYYNIISKLLVKPKGFFKEYVLKELSS